MTLYEIDRQIADLVDTETGEITDFDALDALNMQRETKIEGIALYIKNLTADAKAYKEEKEAFAERQKAAEAKAKRLKEYLSYALQGQKFTTQRCAVSFRKSTAVEVEDMRSVVDAFITAGLEDKVQFAEPTVSKTEISALLKAGREISGAQLVENLNCTVK